MYHWLSAEAQPPRSPDGLCLAAGRVHVLLIGRLSKTIGEAGVRALFARSLRLVRASSPCLHDLDLDDIQQSLEKCLAVHEAAVVEEALVDLLSTFLEVLISLVGEALTWQLLRGLCPSDAEEAPPR